MNEVVKPSKEGKQRYKPDGYYASSDKLRLPCTCLASCPNPCDGLMCRCRACEQAVLDSLD